MASLKEISSLLEPHHFIFLGLTDELDFCHEPEDLQDYRGDWQIALDIPNGGILSVTVTYKPIGAWWSCSTHERFGYYDDEKIIAFARQVIDQVEQVKVRTGGRVRKSKVRNHGLFIQPSLFDMSCES